MTARPSLQEREFIEKTKPYNYLLFKKHGYYFALNGEYGELEFFDEYADVVLNKCMSKLTNGGKILFKPATYVFNNPVYLADKVILEGLGTGPAQAGAVVFDILVGEGKDAILKVEGNKSIQIKNIVFDCKGQVESAVKCTAPETQGIHYSVFQDLSVYSNIGYAFILENPMMYRMNQINVRTRDAGYGGSLMILQSNPNVNNGDGTIYYFKHDGAVTSELVDSAFHFEATAGTLNFIDAYLMMDIPSIGADYNAMLFWGNGGYVKWMKIKTVGGIPADACLAYHKGNCETIVIEDLMSHNTGHTVVWESTVTRCHLIPLAGLNLKPRDLSQGQNMVEEWRHDMLPPDANEIPSFATATIYPILERTVNYGTTVNIGDMALFGPHLATQLLINVTANTLNGSCNVIVQKNGGDTTKSITVSAGGTGVFIEKSTPVEFNRWGQAGERVNVKISAAGTSGSITLSGMLVLATRKHRQTW
ncbi:MAG: hypothetical protein QXX41_08355 [Nitrososphaerota archaeon]